MLYDIQDIDLAIYADKNPQSPNCVFAFGGLAKQFGVPIFEFFKYLNDFQLSKYFIRDHYQAWYQRGLKNYSTNIMETTDVLGRLIDEYSMPQHTTFIGNSSGAFAAILFGSLLGVKKIIAFSPQTFIDKENRERYADDRWSEPISVLHSEADPSHFILDLLPALRNELLPPPSETSIDIHYCIGHELDKIHAERLGEFENVHLIPYSFGGHGLIRDLKESCALYRIINNDTFCND